MADLVVITPSRGRPRQFAELTAAVRDTTDGRVEVLGLVDDDDPTRRDYMPRWVWTGPRRSLSGWTNIAAQTLLNGDAAPRYLASLGDDHRPKTKDWDLKLIAAIEAMDGPGFAYGNDLYQGPALPTAWVASADAVRRIGWMMLPACEHMYVDTAILTLGSAAGRITYRSDVVIEHLHPFAGKADMDQSYRESNAAERYAADKTAFERWRDTQLAADVEKLRSGVSEWP
mgnify:FL=1